MLGQRSSPHPDPLPDQGGEGMASRRRPGTPAVNRWRAFAPLRVSLIHQRIARLELRKRGEIPIRRPEFAHAVVQAQSGDAGVVNARAGESGSQCQVAKFFEIPGAFRKDVQTAACHPRLHGRKGFREGRGWPENSIMGNDTDEFMDARPRDRPWRGLMPQGINQFLCLCVKFAVLAVRINQQVGINRDHAPRPR